MPSFDVVCEANMVEVKNAVEQANKEISTRFDFKGSDARVEQKEGELTAFADDDFKLGIQFNPGRGKGSGSNKGVYLRLFSDFFISDVIIASPLGLRLIIEKFQSSDDGDGGEDGVTSSSALDKQKKKNHINS